MKKNGSRRRAAGRPLAAAEVLPKSRVASAGSPESTVDGTPPETMAGTASSGSVMARSCRWAFCQGIDATSWLPEVAQLRATRTSWPHAGPGCARCTPRRTRVWSASSAASTGDPGGGRGRRDGGLRPAPPAAQLLPRGPDNPEALARPGSRMTWRRSPRFRADGAPLGSSWSATLIPPAAYDDLPEDRLALMAALRGCRSTARGHRAHRPRRCPSPRSPGSPSAARGTVKAPLGRRAASPSR